VAEIGVGEDIGEVVQADPVGLDVLPGKGGIGEGEPHRVDQRIAGDHGDDQQQGQQKPPGRPLLARPFHATGYLFSRTGGRESPPPWPSPIAGEGDICRASFPPPLWGRVRVGGDARTSQASQFRSVSAALPPGGRRSAWPWTASPGRAGLAGYTSAGSR